MSIQKKIFTYVVVFSLVLSVSFVRPQRAAAFEPITMLVASAIVLAVGSSFGIAFEQTGLSPTAFTDIISDKIGEWCEAIGDTTGNFLSTMGEYVSFVGVGKIGLTSLGMSKVGEFLNWFIEQTGIIDVGDSVIIDSVSTDSLFIANVNSLPVDCSIAFPSSISIGNDLSSSKLYSSCYYPLAGQDWSLSINVNGPYESDTNFYLYQVFLRAPDGYSIPNNRNPMLGLTPSLRNWYLTDEEIELGYYLQLYYRYEGDTPLLPNTVYNVDVSMFDIECSSGFSDSLSASLTEPYDGVDSSDVVIEVPSSTADSLDGVATDIMDGAILNSLNEILSLQQVQVETETGILTQILTGVQAVVADISGYVSALPAYLEAGFGLNGIWHYVADWVASIAVGASLIISVWQGLPSAMVVPIYASLVCVIVIGLWRRFFE